MVERPVLFSSSKDELQLQRHQLRVNGCYQIPANKVIHSSKTISSLEHNGAASFIPKTNEALLKCFITDHLQSDQAVQVRQLIEKHMNVFQRHQLDFGLLPDFEVDITLTEHDPPNRVDKYKPICLTYKDNDLINRYCKADVMSPCMHTCTFTSNIFLSLSTNNNWRLIYDMRLAASFTAPLPDREDHNSSAYFELLAEAAHVTSIDINDIHFQLLLSERTRDKLSFLGPDSKRYVCNRSSPGLTFSQHFLNMAINRVLRGLEHRFYISSSTLFIHSDESYSHHMAVLSSVLKAFQ